MKFTKLTSSVLAGATLLSILAPTATFAATSRDGSADAKTNDNGGTALPQSDKTVAGISFGDNTTNGNKGYLRLQMVPHTLDFGNHTLFDKGNAVFTADGKNEDLSSNDRNASYALTGAIDKKGTNLTATLNTQDKELSNVKGTAWATVVDKQVTRVDPMDGPEDTSDPTKPVPSSGFHKGTTSKSGSWTLSVESDDALTAMTNNDPSQKTAETIPGAKLSFANTQYDRTQSVFELTKENEDSTYTTDLAKPTTVQDDQDLATTNIKNNFSTELMNNGTAITVAKAEDGQGQGANVFGWKTTDIKLTMPQGAQVSNAVYKANLTWSLNSTVA
ncbi:WxL domain-containing protein [Latilactobacillus sakei]|uniref:WxL domain-containing protein n=1 Tax=Latilactobacillus sakei TaxID=1599 RepID=UPI000DC649B3|nr:WxL domain-containing protein [Latilactobacillus sakei]SPS07511.1 hypothetical protein LAS9624_01767 [Latilactobacillus sakei]